MPNNITVSDVKKKGKNKILVLPNQDEIILSAVVVKKYALVKGSEIAPQTLDKIKTESDMKRAEDYVLWLLARREYSSGLLKAKLIEKEFSDTTINKILIGLKQKGLVDDTRFARQVIESMLRNKPAGRNYLIGHLQKKRLSRKMAESIIDQFFNNIDEKEIALRLLRSRWRYFSKFDLETARRKAYNYLSRRSIGYGAAKYAFEKVTEEEKKD